MDGGDARTGGSSKAGKLGRRWGGHLVRAAGFLALLSVGAAFAAPAPVRDFETRLRASVASGEVTAAQADLYRLFAVRDAGRLPPELRTDGDPAVQLLRVEGVEGAVGPALIRCGTPILRGVRARLGELSSGQRAAAEALLALPTAAAPRVGERVAGKVVTHQMTNWVLTDNFSIEWGPDLTDEDGTFPAADADGDSVPDVVELWASYFEASFGVIIGSGRFPSAELDAHLIPVYLGNSDPLTTLDNISSGTYAFTSEGSPVPYIVVNNDFRFVPANGAGAFGEAKWHGAMEITAAHELFHVIHFLYEPAGWNIQADDWWLETSATWMEEEVFDSINDYHQYYGAGGWASFAGTGLPVDRDDAHYVTRAYGGAIFAKYLSEHVGGAESMGAVWEQIRPGGVTPDGQRILDALDAYAVARGFESVEDLYLGFAAANAGMDYEEGADYGAVPVQSSGTTLDPDPASGISAYLGAAYVKRTGGAGGPAEISLSPTDPVTGWGLALWVERAGGEPLALGATGPITLTDIGTADVYGIPAFLDPAGTPVSYALAEGAATATDTTAPGSPTLGTPVAAAGGFDLGWTPPTDPDVAGYVVTWDDGGTNPGHRTLYGPVTTIEVRGLPAATYTVSVYAYDEAGNADRPGASTTAVMVADGPADTPVPAANITEVVIGGSVGGGGGGGGGGCFLGALR